MSFSEFMNKGFYIGALIGSLLVLLGVSSMIVGPLSSKSIIGIFTLSLAGFSFAIGAILFNIGSIFFNFGPSSQSFIEIVSLFLAFIQVSFCGSLLYIISKKTTTSCQKYIFIGALLISYIFLNLLAILFVALPRT